VLQNLLRDNGLTPVSKRTGQPAATRAIHLRPPPMVPALASKQI